jgi:hypothetical protein
MAPSLDDRLRKHNQKMKAVVKTKTLLDRINAENNSNSNNRPISAAANSVTSTVISEYVKVKKTISYLIHYNSRLTLH